MRDLDLPFSQAMRLVWIDATVEFTGQINRSNICASFGISIPQASNDLRVFQLLFPDRLIYDRSAKLYRRAPNTHAAFEFVLQFWVLKVTKQIGDLCNA